MDQAYIRSKFINLFKSNPILTSAPGRINLIGEHTDYNEGYVLPGAIDKKAYFAIALNGNDVFRFHASDLDQTFETKEIEKAPSEFQWANYLLGVLNQFEKQGVVLKGVDCVFASDIPVGAGLSSSAAIECAFTYGINILLDAGFSDHKLALLAQNAEHEFAGVMCGIMDQFASVFGKKDHVLRLDCRTHEHIYYQFKSDNLVIALCDSGVKHELASSEYNIRRHECESGVAYLQQYDPSIKSLRDLTKTLLKKYQNDIDPVVYKRCLYVINENDRVFQACEALKRDDFKTLGQLIYQSHKGLQHEFEVSCKELDILVELTHDLDYVYGSRMMGGGFGGCTINLVKKEKKIQFQQLISKEYQSQTGINPNIYFVQLSNGVNVIK